MLVAEKVRIMCSDVNYNIKKNISKSAVLYLSV